jgi:threonine aldolase
MSLEDLKNEYRAARDGCVRHFMGPARPSIRTVLQALADAAGAHERPDIYGGGHVITEFEEEMAALLGKPSAVFMMSGTMAQQIALRVWCDRRALKTVAFHPTAHLETREDCAYQELHQLEAVLVGDPSTALTRADLDAVRQPVAALLLELPQSELGGVLPAWDDLIAQIAWARERSAARHLDGARFFEAAASLGCDYATLADLFDSVYVSMYKGVGGIAGAVLAGPEDFVAEARVWQHRHGGLLVSQYPYVVAARTGLRRRLPHFLEYRARTLALAAHLRTVPGVSIRPDPPQSLMMQVGLPMSLETALRRATALSRETGDAIFWMGDEGKDPQTSWLELTVNEPAAAFTDGEVGDYLRRLVLPGTSH